VAGEVAEGGEAAKAGVAAADAKGGEKKAGAAAVVPADAKGGEKKGAVAPKAEKKETEKKK
jgi:hypothetical protein